MGGGNGFPWQSRGALGDQLEERAMASDVVAVMLTLDQLEQVAGKADVDTVIAVFTDLTPYLPSVAEARLPRR